MSFTVPHSEPPQENFNLITFWVEMLILADERSLESKRRKEKKKNIVTLKYMYIFDSQMVKDF